jgi:uncharacterized protein YjbI with pentapeptide repeats
VAFALGLVAAGCALWFPHRGGASTANSDLGLTLLGSGLALAAGGIVAYAVFVAEKRFDAALRASDEERERAAQRALERAIERTSLQQTLFLMPTLEGINLSDRDLSGFFLREKSLMSAELRNADMRDAILIGANLRYADLTEADLRRADLRGADLTGAPIIDAELSDAKLHGAKLEAADLRNAKLHNADLSDANLDLAKMNGVHFDGALYSEYTTWPSDFDPEAAGGSM